MPTDCVITRITDNKHFSLSAAMNVNLLQKFDCGTSVWYLTEEYILGTAVMRDLNTQKNKTICSSSQSIIRCPIALAE